MPYPSRRRASVASPRAGSGASRKLGFGHGGGGETSLPQLCPCIWSRPLP